jgi:hypothetical protein
MFEKPLPEPLEEAIERASSTMLEDERHDLLPIYRRRIYTAIGPWENVQARQVRIRLDLLSARYVLFIWQKYRPSDTWPEQLISVAEGVLAGTVDQVVAARKANEAQFQLDEALPTLVEELEVGEEEPLGALSAALVALRWAAGITAFDVIEIAEQETDREIDPLFSDSAGWAAIAYAKAAWEPGSNSEKRKEFWQWWLKEAVPQAWRKSTTGTQP